MYLSVSRPGSPLSRLLFFLSFAISYSWTTSVNRTIDDYFGDLVVYSKGWIRCPGDGGCCAEASAGAAFDETYTCSGGTANDTNAATLTLKFNGTAIYVYGLSPYSDFIQMNWVATLDGKVPHESFTADVGGPSNVLLYSKSDLDSTNHTLIIGPSDVKQFFVFDYATYTYEDSQRDTFTPTDNGGNPALIWPIGGGVIGAIVIFSVLMCLIRRARNRTRKRSTQMVQLSSPDDWRPKPRSEIITLPSGETQLSLVSQPVPPLPRPATPVEDTRPQPLTTLQDDIQALSREIQELSRGVEDLSHDAEASQTMGPLANLPRQSYGEHQPNAEIVMLRERLEAMEQLQLHLQASLAQETGPPAYTPI
ncbi:hypothetical protein B0H19DRAFT_1383267 [Mycena capillaripes]|nr:hypothetical protein B0H19DRAFT_1383267 [Mycena capillaripes]